MKQRLGIAVALLNNPACLVLDEPFNGLDPLGVAALQKLIVELTVKEDLAVILSSHIIEELRKYLQHLVCIKGGTNRKYRSSQKTNSRKFEYL